MSSARHRLHPASSWGRSIPFSVIPKRPIPFIVIPRRPIPFSVIPRRPNPFSVIRAGPSSPAAFEETHPLPRYPRRPPSRVIPRSLRRGICSQKKRRNKNPIQKRIIRHNLSGGGATAAPCTRPSTICPLRGGQQRHGPIPRPGGVLGVFQAAPDFHPGPDGHDRPDVPALRAYLPAGFRLADAAGASLIQIGLTNNRK